MVDLLKLIKNDNYISNILNSDSHKISVEGINEEFLSVFIKMLNDVKGSLVLIMPSEKEAKQISNLLNNSNLRSIYIPPRDKVFYDIKILDNSNSKERIDGIYNLVFNNDSIVYTMTLNTATEVTLNKEIVTNNIIEISSNDVLDLEKFSEKMVILGYDKVSHIETRGEYSIRGGIIDVFPLNYDGIIRIELFDDLVDSIRLVNPSTQKSTQRIENVKIPQFRELILTDEIISNIKENLLDDIKGKKLIKKEKFAKILENLDSKIYPNEREILYSYLSVQYLSSLIDLSNNYVVIWNKVLSLNNFEDELKFRDLEITSLLESGEIIKYPVGNSDLDDIIKKKKIYYLDDFTQNFESDHFKVHVESAPRFNRNYFALIDDSIAYIKNGFTVFWDIGDNENKKSIINILEERNINYTKDHLEQKLINIIDASIEKGFILNNQKIIVYGRDNILGTKEKKVSSKKNRNNSTLRLSELNVGDYVIHFDHGVGIYRGVKTLDIKGVKKDFIEIQYKGTDKLYVSVENITQLDKYMSKEGVTPKIHSLNSSVWKNTKEKNKKAIEEMAKDLIELYSKRQNIEGFKFSEDTNWQREFESMFEFQETDGQLLATDQIKTDMQKSSPMDRLLLGDVGYGKTEVAFRAAFKAVMDSKQVIFLTPTTLLSEQHYRTALERFKNFPVKIEVLNRFKKKTEVDKILKDLKAGNIDIIIGTHRLLSKDVKFKDMGLLIVDEEQRFGVKHKESIKKISETVDVLTLSATPIPRTLSMSLSGIRSLSVLDEPPENRIPVQTYVIEYEENIIRNSILKEINRNGQIYFLYNNVKDMENMTEKLSELVPEAKFIYANGQMPERQLEKVFASFINKEYDCLVTSTIIETGMDISSANTLIVYDAQNLGLSTLYQLRGRVGRSNKLAYAYFTYPEKQSLNEKSVKRLMAMKEFTDFGSGYKIAMRDLELRGAGNVLGVKQHGHMAEIGYELYMKFLSEAVKVIHGEKIENEIETKIDIDISSNIPKDFIEDEIILMEIYRKIASIQDFNQRDEMIDELIDRFGDVPKEVENLVNIGLIKNIASKFSIISIKQNGELIKIEYEPIMLEKIQINDLIKKYPDITFDGKLPIFRIIVKNNPINYLLSLFKYLLFENSM